MDNRPRLLYLVTEDWYFWSHRLDLARGARDAGYSVTIATRVTDHGDRIRQEGFQLEPLGMVRRSRNPLQEFAAIVELARLYRRVKPDVVHHVAIKPILYGSIAAWVSPVPVVINAFAGLGYAFMDQRQGRGIFRSVLTAALKLGISKSGSTVLCQHEIDRDRLVQMGVVLPSQARIIAGSGVNTDEFSVKPPVLGVPIVVLPARMLWDKGVGEFVQAARTLKAKGVVARFVLVGRVDGDNPSAITEAQLDQWAREEAVEWWGYREDMPALYERATLVVLPTSYGEGLPKVLLEAAACGKALIATDIPGCRNVVRPGVNGLLVAPKDPTALAMAIEHLLSDHRLREIMGLRSRELAVAEWSSSTIVGQMLNLYQELLKTPSAHDRLPRYA